MSNMKYSPPVVFYRYEASPASAKIENVLALKSVPHYRVEVAMTLPRPEISDALGIGYRRIPVLAIGNDVYCDTSLIASALESQFPPGHGFQTIFPQRKDGESADTGMVEMLAAFYADRPLFSLATEALPYDKFSPEFIEDRNKMSGSSLNIEKTVARRPVVRSLLSSHMNFLENQLADGREWVFDTITPGYGDLALQHVFGWVIRFKGMREVLTKEKFPHSNAWLDRMGRFIKTIKEANSNAVNKIDGTAAAKIIAESLGTQGKNIHFDYEEATLLGLKLGDKTQVVPDDNAKTFPTIGNLVGINREEVVLQLSGSTVPSLRCHFPRLNYSVGPVTNPAHKL